MEDATSPVDRRGALGADTQLGSIEANVVRLPAATERSRTRQAPATEAPAIETTKLDDVVGGCACGCGMANCSCGGAMAASRFRFPFRFGR